ncbi:DUF4097 family beta strand repeat-containing protein [Colwellia sp. E150_009]
MNSVNKYIMAALIFTSLLFIPVTMAGKKVDETIKSDGVNTVTIENLSGKVIIVGWDKEWVTVKGELDDKAKKLVFEQVARSINIKVDIPKNDRRRTKGSILTIHMPADLRMNFESMSSDVELENLTNNVSVKTISGDINAKNLAEHIELSSVSGSIKAKSLQGKINLSTVSGDIKDENSSGRLQLKVVSGDIMSKSDASEVFVNNVSGNIKLQLTKVDELNISEVSGDAKISLFLQRNGIVKASSVSGAVTLDFQDDVAADFRLKANAGGDLTNKLTAKEAEKAKYGSSEKLYFQTGNANSSVSVNTVSGDITVK